MDPGLRLGVLLALVCTVGCASGNDDEGAAGVGAAGDGSTAGVGVAGASAGAGEAGVSSAGTAAPGIGTAGDVSSAGVDAAGTGAAGDVSSAGTGAAGTGTAGTGTAGTGTAGTGTAGTGTAGTGGPGVCGGETPHGCYTPVSTNTAECPEQIPEQTEGPVVPLPEWVSCGTPANVCKYTKPSGGEANCFCDTGVHWICTYGAP
jgi:hypothetical protein